MAPIPRERALRDAYIAEKCAGLHVKINCPLGMPPEPITLELGLERALQLSRPSRPSVDVIIVDRDRLVLVEFKITRWLDGVSKLPAYRAMIGFTPELKEYQSWPAAMRLVIPFHQENILMTAFALGVEVEEFTTPEIDRYVQVELPKYYQAAWKKQRAERKQTLIALGLE